MRQQSITQTCQFLRSKCVIHRNKHRIVTVDLHQFNRSTLEQRAGIVMKHGTFLAIRHRSQYIISLYHINQFFAEMWYEPRRHDFVLVRGLTDSVALEPYLAMIRLSEIMP